MILVDELTAFAAGDARLVPVVAGLTKPIRVAVRGRAGVGCSTVADALRRGGWQIADLSPGIPDVDVLVVVETVKPEDLRICAARTCPMLVVVNKADLLGAAVSRQLAEIGRRSGQPTVALDCALSRIDDVSRALTAVAAPVRYQRLQAALTQVRAIAAGNVDLALWQWLASDTAVLAVATVAAEVMAGAGFSGAHTAAQWSRYARAPVSALHAGCAAAVARGAQRSAVPG